MADIAIFRINYKSDFILTLNSDAGWMTPFCIKFWTGAPSQAYFVGFDGTTYTHCAPVAGEPTKLRVQFDDHHLPIGDLKFQIGYHFTVADFPNDTEDEVLNQANITTEIDGETYQVMLDFNGETAPEIEFSLPAYANEAQRIANEEARIAAEQQRIANEDARIQAEDTRQRNEQQRIQQEAARVNEFATLKSQSQAATRDANDAATLANQKAQLAADKAALADAAATLANQKAQLAADKAALANAAAQLANEKAALAQQKAEYAQQQGGYAKDQGDYAKNQGNYAKEQGDTALADHQRAEADHGIAVDDHTQAGNDHTRAESDHGIAVNDHTQAGNDHTRAESDHGIAVDDHTQAGNDHTRAEADHGTAADDHTQAGNDHTRAESDHTRAESDHAAVEVYVDSLGAFDISAYNATGGVLAKYADLTAALGTNGANIPEGIRKGGMSVKFVQSSDNKYVQYYYMGTEITGTPNPFLDTANWQGVDDEPTAGSKNLVKSEGINASIVKTTKFLSKEVTEYENLGCLIKGDGTFGNSAYYKHGAIQVTPGDNYVIESCLQPSVADMRIAFATSNSVTAGSAIPLVTGTSPVLIPSLQRMIVTIPDGCAYLLFNTFENSQYTKVYKVGENFFFASGEELNSVSIDKQAIKNSNNPIASKVVYDLDSTTRNNYDEFRGYSEHVGYINEGTNKWGYLSDQTYSYIIVPVKSGQEITFVTSGTVYFACLKSYDSSSVIGGETPDFSATINEVKTIYNRTYNFSIPSDCNYLYIQKLRMSVNRLPETFLINGVNFYDSTRFSTFELGKNKVSKPQSAANNNICLFDENQNIKDSDININEIDKDRIIYHVVNDGHFISCKNYALTDYSLSEYSNFGCLVIDVKAGDKFNVDIQGGDTPRSYAFTNKDNYIVDFSDNVRITGTITAPSDGKLIINNNFMNLGNPYVIKVNMNDGRVGDYHVGGFATRRAQIGDTIDMTLKDNPYYTHTIINCVEGDVFKISGRCSYSGVQTIGLMIFLDNNNKKVSGTFNSSLFKNKIVRCPVGATKLLVQFDLYKTAPANYIPFSVHKLDSYTEKIYNSREEYVQETGNTFEGDVFKVKVNSGIGWTQWREPLVETYFKDDRSMTAMGVIDIYSYVGVAVLEDTGIYTCCNFHYSGMPDTHNNSAVTFKDDKMYVGFGSGHSYNNKMYMAVFDDLSDLTKYTLYVMPISDNPEDCTTYCNMFFNNGYWYLFYRDSGSGWPCLKTSDFINTTIIKNDAVQYYAFKKVKGYENLIRIVSAQNGAFSNNYIKEVILNLDTFKVMDDSLNELGTFENLGTIFGNVQSLVPSTLGDYTHIRLFDYSIPQTELNDIVIGYARYTLGEDGGKYYLYKNGVSIEIDDCGEPYYPTSGSLPDITTCDLNTNVVVYAKKTSELCELCVGIIKNNVISERYIIDSTKDWILLPVFVQKDYTKVAYLRGIWGDPTSFTTWKTTSIIKDIEIPF